MIDFGTGVEGSFVVKTRINEQDVYAKVRLTVCKMLLPRIDLDLNGFGRRETTIRFAADYFYDHYGERGGLKITMLELGENDTDEDEVVIFFAVVQALYQALGKVCHLTIDEAGNFVVPR